MTRKQRAVPAASMTACFTSRQLHRDVVNTADFAQA
jgi:hypothetical protein